MNTRKRKPNIISYLNKHYGRRNVFFGEIIHQLKPKNISEWEEYLKSKKWYLISGLSRLGYKKADRGYWIHYLINSFWKAYVSETNTMKFFKTKFNKTLEFAPHSLDLKYGIDFIYDHNNFVIVKCRIYDEELNKFLDYKKLNKFSYEDLNNTNSVIWVFESSKQRLFKYNSSNNSLEIVDIN